MVRSRPGPGGNCEAAAVAGGGVAELCAAPTRSAMQRRPTAQRLQQQVESSRRRVRTRRKRAEKRSFILIGPEAALSDVPYAPTIRIRLRRQPHRRQEIIAAPAFRQRPSYRTRGPDRRACTSHRKIADTCARHAAARTRRWRGSMQIAFPIQRRLRPCIPGTP